MSKGGGTTVQQATLTLEQKEQIAAQTKFFTETIKPTYERGVRGAEEIYSQFAPGQLAAGQNLGRIAQQAQESLGGTGESALRTGVGGLQSLFDKDYERTQIMSALMPAQAQYMQNMANQQAQFGGAGQLGSARQALAAGQAAGATQAAQMQAAAGIQQQIAAQRAQAANQLASIGASNIGQALGAAGQQVSASMLPQQLYNQYASVIFGAPAASYTPDFRGTQGYTASRDEYGFNPMGVLGLGSNSIGGGLFGSMMAKSDRRLKEAIVKIKTVDGIPVYKFRYKGEPGIYQGTMAQDLLRDSRYRHAVHRHKEGYFMVDYGQLPAGVREE